MERSADRRFEELTDWLSEQFELWSARPFVGLPVSWEASYPKMAQSLRALSLERIAAAEAEAGGVEGIAEPFGSLAMRCGELGSWSTLPRSSVTAFKPLRVPGRKCAQIEHFVGTVRATALPDISRWLDWCSGKGHLGRSIAESLRARCTCLEIDAGLCDRGREELSEESVDVALKCADVLSDDVSSEIDEGTGIVALHACGELHMRLLELAVPTSRYIAFAPCCYHRLPGDEYQPLSTAGKTSRLRLTRHHLLLAAYDENIAGAAGKELRQREQAWRLAVDLLQREGSGIDRYQQLGAVPVRWLRGSFEEFARRLQRRKDLVYPANWSPERAEAHGWERNRIVRSLALVRGLFRRPLESWAVLDRVLFLEEAGYEVAAGEFCPREVTPRNLMVIGSRR